MKIAVGSTNPCKVASVRAAFARSFPEREIEVHGCSVPSGVSDQPMGSEETLRGARNRAAAAAAAVACDFSVGLEGGLELTAAGALSCFAWMAVRSTGDAWGTSRTGSFDLPPPIARLVQSGLELGDADDRFFQRTGSKQTDGVVGLLTAGLIDRAAYYEHALVLALIPFTNLAMYSAAARACTTEEEADRLYAAETGDGSATALTLDFSAATSEADLWAECRRVLCPTFTGFGANLDALVDVLRGGFGVKPPFKLRVVGRDAGERAAPQRWRHFEEIFNCAVKGEYGEQVESVAWVAKLAPP